jgi:hypothetical protein
MQTFLDVRFNDSNAAESVREALEKLPKDMYVLQGFRQSDADVWPVTLTVTWSNWRGKKLVLNRAEDILAWVKSETGIKKLRLVFSNPIGVIEKEAITQLLELPPRFEIHLEERDEEGPKTPCLLGSYDPRAVNDFGLDIGICDLGGIASFCMYARIDARLKSR